MDIKIIRHNLIDAIMQTTDFEQLVEMYNMIMKEKKETKAVEMLESVETAVEKPIKEIPIVEIKKGVTLEEIKASQETSPKNYNRIVEMFEDEEWEQPLEELLESLD